MTYSTSTAVNELASKASVIMFLLLTIAFSPLLCFIFGLLFLFFLKTKCKSIETKIISILISIAASISVASRNALSHESDDMLRYFDLFQTIDTSSATENYNEIGIRLIYLALKYIYGEMSIGTFLFIHCFALTLVFIGFLFKFVDKMHLQVDSRFIAVSLLFFSYSMTTQLSRYFLAVLILCYSLVFFRPFSKLILISTATLFHSTAPFVYIFYKFSLKKIGVLHVITFLLVLYASFNFSTIAPLILGLLIPGMDKLAYALEFPGYDEPSVMSIISVLIFFSALTIIKGNLLKNKSIPLQNILFVSISFAIALLPVAIMPLRLLFPLTSIFNGMIIAYLLLRFSPLFQRFCFVMFIAYKFYAFSGINSNPNFELWTNYPPAGVLPFYYLY